LNSSLLTISVIAVLLPSVFNMALQGQSTDDGLLTDYKILKTSHGVRTYHVLHVLNISSPY